MRAYNIEVFSPSFHYKGSGQTDSVEYKYDYTDVEKNAVEIDIPADNGDYIVIYNDNLKIYGIVCDVSSETQKKIQYKPISKLFDTKILATFNATESVENTIQRLVEETYINNPDELQNVYGLNVESLTSTTAEYGWTFADGAVNLMDIVQEAFNTYGIVCDFIIDRQEKEITLTIEKVSGGEFYIEPNLPNILEKKIVIQQSKETVNKVVIYNEADISETAIFYKDLNEEITQAPEGRWTPVVFTTKSVKVGKNQTFLDRALAAAASTIKKTQYQNLMEFTVQADDLLLRPYYRSIGQQASIYVDGKIYSTILTGYEYKENQAKLIFGTIRQELTKQLKKKWRAEWQ